MFLLNLFLHIFKYKKCFIISIMSKKCLNFGSFYNWYSYRFVNLLKDGNYAWIEKENLDCRGWPCRSLCSNAADCQSQSSTQNNLERTQLTRSSRIQVISYQPSDNGHFNWLQCAAGYLKIIYQGLYNRLLYSSKLYNFWQCPWVS